MVEVLIAISILLMATVGPMTIAARAQQAARYVREQNTAFFLAQEGIEAVVAIRNVSGLMHIKDPVTYNSDDWLNNAALSSCGSANGCGLHFNNSSVVSSGACPAGGCPLYFKTGSQRAIYTHNEDGTSVPTAYSRAVLVEPLSDSVRVTSLVSWQPTTGTALKVVELETYLYDIYNTN